MERGECEIFLVKVFDVLVVGRVKFMFYDFFIENLVKNVDVYWLCGIL